MSATLRDDSRWSPRLSPSTFGLIPHTGGPTTAHSSITSPKQRMPTQPIARNIYAVPSSSKTTTTSSSTTDAMIPRSTTTGGDTKPPAGSIAKIFSKLIDRVESGKPFGGNRHAKLGGMMPPSSVAAHVVGLGGSVGGSKAGMPGPGNNGNNSNSNNKTLNDSSSSRKMLPPVSGSPRHNPYSRSVVLSGSGRPSRLSHNNDSTPVPPIGYESTL